LVADATRVLAVFGLQEELRARRTPPRRAHGVAIVVNKMTHGFERYKQKQGFLPTATFLPPGSGRAVYRGIPLDTARIQISNQNSLLPLVQTVLNGIPRYK
jgi:hypothetical protein